MARKERKENAKKPIWKKNRYPVIIIVVVLGIFLVMVFYPTKQANRTSTPSVAPPFSKQGELTFLGRDGRELATIDLEIADDDYKREIGLMGRPTMEERQGMLFVFQKEHPVAFWMKNTLLPLDMIFIDAKNQIVTIHKNTTPFSEQTYPSDVPVLYVLELNAGFADTYRIDVGNAIRWKRF